MNAMTNDKTIYIKGARVHNLKNVDVTIPHNTLTVITGLSGSGKSPRANAVTWRASLHTRASSWDA